MKKLVLVIGIVAMVLSFCSCSKNCVCKQYVDGQMINTVTTEGKGKCSDMNVTQTTMGMTQKTECENE